MLEFLQMSLIISFIKNDFPSFPQLTAHSKERDLFCLDRLIQKWILNKRYIKKKLLIAFLFTWNITCTVIISSFTQSCPTLWDPMDCSLPGSEEPLSAWNLPGKSPGVVAISFSRESSQPRDRTRVSHTAGRRFYGLSHQEDSFTRHFK